MGKVASLQLRLRKLFPLILNDLSLSRVPATWGAIRFLGLQVISWDGDTRFLLPLVPETGTFSPQRACQTRARHCVVAGAICLRPDRPYASPARCLKRSR